MYTFWPTRVFIHEVRQVIYFLVDNDPKITNAVVLGNLVFRKGQLGSGCRHGGREERTDPVEKNLEDTRIRRGSYLTLEAGTGQPRGRIIALTRTVTTCDGG